MISKSSFLILLALGSILMVSCNRNCPSGGGASYVYVDTRIVSDENTLNYPVWLQDNMTMIEYLSNNSIARAYWMSGNCKSYSKIFITENGSSIEIAKNKPDQYKKNELNQYITKYNDSCNGCVKEILIATYV